MKVREFIAWLAAQDQEATVEVICVTPGRAYECDNVNREEFDPEEHVTYTDMRGNKFAVGKPYENSRTLFLGDDSH